MFYRNVDLSLSECTDNNYLYFLYVRVLIDTINLLVVGNRSHH